MCVCMCVCMYVVCPTSVNCSELPLHSGNRLGRYRGLAKKPLPRPQRGPCYLLGVFEDARSLVVVCVCVCFCVGGWVDGGVPLVQSLTQLWDPINLKTCLLLI